jgi:hypothetical protein
MSQQPSAGSACFNILPEYLTYLLGLLGKHIALDIASRRAIAFGLPNFRYITLEGFTAVILVMQRHSRLDRLSRVS